MNKTIALFAVTCSLAVITSICHGSTPVLIVDDTSSVRPIHLKAYRGAELALDAAIYSYGSPLDLGASDAGLYWQTNGMGALWWTAPATITNHHHITAIWSPTNDVGADVYNMFLGVPGDKYAHLILRMEDSPGATPNVLPLPAVTYDAALNGNPTINGTNLAEWVAARSQEESDPRAPEIVSNIVTRSYVEDLGTSSGGSSIDTNAVIDLIAANAPPPGNYEAVSNAAMNAASIPSGADGFAPWTDAGGTRMLMGDYGVGNFYVSELFNMYVPAQIRFTSVNKSLQDMLDDKSDTSQTGELWNYLMAENFRATITNYDSVAHAPEASFEYRMSTNDPFRVVWTETNGLARTFTAATNAAIAAAKAEIAKPDNRAWGRYDSQTGEAAPDGVVTVSAAGGMMIGSGMQYTSIAASGGQYWVLTSTDPVLCATGTNGVFEIRDSGGNNVMTVRKGDKRLVPAPASAVSTTSSSIVITYAIESDEHPVIECTDDLKDGAWTEAGDTGAAFGAAVWTGDSGAWTATIPRGDGTCGFFRASYWAGGGTVVEYGAAIHLTTIDIGGHQYTVGTATINGKTVLTLE